MNEINEKHRKDFIEFANEMMRTNDFDPNYFTVKGVCETRSYSAEDAFKYSFIFNAFYNFQSAETYFKNPQADVKSLAYGTSRRGFRANKKVLIYLSEVFSLKKYIFKEKDNGEDGWRRIYEMLCSIQGNGPWGAYYGADQLKVICGFNITAPNIGGLCYENGNRGPVNAMSLITGVPIKEIVGDELAQKEIYNSLLPDINFQGMESFESILCNYLSLLKGKYYVGRDIDRQIPMLTPEMLDHWEAREKYFPNAYLGEFGGWNKIRKEEMGNIFPDNSPRDGNWNEKRYDFRPTQEMKL